MLQGRQSDKDVSMKECFLTFDRGSGPNTVHPLMDLVTIGRSTDNTITIPDKTVSRNHARIIFREGVWTIEDLGSVNGVIVNGKRMDKRVLASGDIFKIGKFTFRFIEREIPKTKDHLFKTMSILSDSVASQGLPAEKQVVEPWWTKQVEDVVSVIPFLSHLGETERKNMLETGALHIFNAGEMIIREGDEGRSIYVILDGRVKSFIKGHISEELELTILGASQFFGERSFFTGNPSQISVMALDKSLIIEFNYTNMQRLIQKHPPVETIILNYYQDRLADSREIITRSRS